MSARKRDSETRSASSDSRMTYGEFLRMFPTNQACMDYLRDRSPYVQADSLDARPGRRAAFRQRRNGRDLRRREASLGRPPTQGRWLVQARPDGAEREEEADGFRCG